ncbi:MAG: AmmeMemoRadiSam system protein B [Candidatus Eiseniibacteriota bacterium]
MSEERDPGSRIILPGGVRPGGIVGPDGRPISSHTLEEEEGAPGSSGGPALPSHPRLRPLEVQEVREGGRSMVVLSDPSGIAPQAIAVSAEALPLLMLLDGSVALADLMELVDRETGDTRAGENVRKLVEELDQRLLLESPRYFEARDAVRAAYRAEPSRTAALAGISYPADAPALTSFLAAHDEMARTWRDGKAPAPGVPGDTTGLVGTHAPPTSAPATTAPRAIAAPHIDPRRGGSLLARAYLELDGLTNDALPDVIFVFGTGHAMLEEPYAITAKAYETPLGSVPTDGEIVRAIVERAGEFLWAEEMAHRDEHSIEFQAIALRHRLGAKSFRMVPILCGGFHALLRTDQRPEQDSKVEALVAAVSSAAAGLERDGQKVAFVAGVDLSHVGARFGDVVDLDSETLGDIEKRDRDALAAAARGDAGAWFDAIAAHGDSTRICGYAAMYTMLRVAAPGDGRLLAYEQSLEEGGSVVSYASMVWPGSRSTTQT